MKNSLSHASLRAFCSSPVDFYGIFVCYRLLPSCLSTLLSVPDCSFFHAGAKAGESLLCRSEQTVHGVELQVPQKYLFLIWNCHQTCLLRSIMLHCHIGRALLKPPFTNNFAVRLVKDFGPLLKRGHKLGVTLLPSFFLLFFWS